MKRFFFALALLLGIGVAFSACQKAPFLTMTGVSSVEVSADGGSSSITFSTNRDWTVSCSENWIHVGPSSGTAADGVSITAIVRCDANTTYDARSAAVTIKAEGLTQTFIVNQPANLGIIVPTKSYNLASDARSIEVEVQANVQYMVSISDKWIKQTETKGLTTNKLTFNIEENDSYDARSATITIKPQNTTVQEQVITVKQAQKDALIIKDTSFDMPYGGGEIEFKVEANVSFDITPSVGWIHIVSTKAMATSSVRLSVDENETFANREGKVEIKQKNGTLSHTVTIKQAGRIAVTSVELSKTRLNLKEGDTETLVATVRPDNATDNTITWFSSDTNVAEVDINGKVSAIKEGIATISVRAGNLEASCNVEVYSETKALVFEVKATISNGYEVYLPISTGISDSDDQFNHYSIRGIIDWGDGDFEHFDGEKIPYLTHLYESSNKHYIIKVYSRGITICSNRIDTSKRNSIVRIIQWGDPGIRIMSSAFTDHNSLESIPADVLGAFSGLKSLEAAFRNCVNLKEIDKDVFKYCENVVQMADIFSGCSNLETLPDGLFSHCSSVPSFARAFQGCTQLQHIPSNLFNSCTNVLSYANAFSGCSSLTNVPAILFSSSSKAEDFSSVFANCSKLTSLPEALFYGCVSAKTFAGAFYKTGIKDLPADLFSYCPNVESFARTFEMCKLTSLPETLFLKNTKVKSFESVFNWAGENMNVPESLFSACAEVESFRQAFYYSSVKSIPTCLFDNNRRVLNFSSTFSGCVHPKEETPYTIINGEKYHLYERVKCPDEFVTPTIYSYCFGTNTSSSWTDYETIPYEWGR